MPWTWRFYESGLRKRRIQLIFPHFSSASRAEKGVLVDCARLMVGGVVRRNASLAAKRTWITVLDGLSIVETRARHASIFYLLVFAVRNFTQKYWSVTMGVELLLGPDIQRFVFTWSWEINGRLDVLSKIPRFKNLSLWLASRKVSVVSDNSLCILIWIVKCGTNRVLSETCIGVCSNFTSRNSYWNWLRDNS